MVKDIGLIALLMNGINSIKTQATKKGTNLMAKHNYRSYEPITRHTKAGRAGQYIKCPHCDRLERRVYHMDWPDCTCRGCNRKIDKYDWLIEESVYR